MPLPNDSSSIISRLSSLYNSLTKSIVGSSVDDLVDAEKSIRRLNNYANLNSATRLSDLIKSITGIENTDDAYKKILESSVNSMMYIEENRLNRYREYDSIEEKIGYVKRALNVMTQNILSPDDYTEEYFNIVTINKSMKPNSVIIDNIRNMLIDNEIYDYCKDIVYNTLKYGDYFVEIVSIDETLRRNKLLETKEFVLVENENNNNNKSQIILNFHSPYNVVKIGNRVILGYVVFPEFNRVNTNSPISNDLINSSSSIADRIIDKIRGLSKNKREDLLKSKEDLSKVIVRLLLSSPSKANTQIQTRFVPTDRMVNFIVNRNRFAPYGTSILFGTEFLARILIAIQGSIMIQRLTRVVDRRMFEVELGPSRDAATYIEAFKEKMERRKFTIDSIGTIDSLPSQLASFEDIYLPMKNGKKFVEYDAIPPQGELSSRVDDLKSIRDEIVASLDVPPAYLGIEENIESKNTLSQQNVVFANTITYYQKELARKFNELIYKMSYISSPNANEIQNYKLTFNPPLSLVAEKNSEYYQSISNIFSSLSSMGIPAEYIINKYLPSFNWAEIEQLKAKKKMSDIILGKSEGE